MAFSLPPLPYDREALAPHMSAETLDYHHGKHHKAYVDNLNGFVEKGVAPKGGLVDIIRSGATGPVFNNAAQVWNHSFFWLGLKPAGEGNGARPEALEKALEDAFGSFEAFREKFIAEAVGHFASGWAWLVKKDGKLEVTSYHDADSPVAHQGVEPLFTIDVWEHAYYIDHRNVRKAFVEAVFDNLANWAFVAENLNGKGAEQADQQG